MARDVGQPEDRRIVGLATTFRAARTGHLRDRTHIKSMTKFSSILTAQSRREPILVCKKCLKRVPNGTRIKQALKAAVKHRNVAQSSRRPRVVLTSCFGICPKRAVVVASAATLNRGEYVLLRNADQVGEAGAVLMPSDGR